MSLQMYENIRLPPPTLGCDDAFCITLLFGPIVSQYIINDHFQFGKKWHM